MRDLLREVKVEESIKILIPGSDQDGCPEQNLDIFTAFRAGSLFELWANVLEYPESG